jgi:hypothetical protein
VSGGQGDGIGAGGPFADHGEPPAQAELGPDDRPDVVGVVDHDDVVGAGVHGFHGTQRPPVEFGPSRRW